MHKDEERQKREEAADALADLAMKALHAFLEGRAEFVINSASPTYQSTVRFRLLGEGK